MIFLLICFVYIVEVWLTAISSACVDGYSVLHLYDGWDHTTYLVPPTPLPPQPTEPRLPLF